MASDTDRSDRLAAALRANLQRRKSQARARRAPQESDAPSAPTTPSTEASGGNPATGGSSAPSEGKPAIVPEGEAG